MADPPPNKRKRKRSVKDLSSSGSSSSSSDDDDEEEDGSEDDNNHNKRQEHGGDDGDEARVDSGSFHRQDASQSEGWRVKLYRLNADGSWDDCGTGRISCLYRTSSPTPEATSNSKDSSPLDQWLYDETGEATLVVNAEPTKGSSNTNNNTKNNNDAAFSSPTNNSDNNSRVLLRTRILLREAYQRQGDNIITWCEPYFTSPLKGKGKTTPSGSSNNNNNSNRNAGGVDLALSFQDNEGCLDVWSHITRVQSRAAELLQSKSVQDMAAQVAAQHHADLCQQQERDLFLWNQNTHTNNRDDNNNNNNNNSSNNTGSFSTAHDTHDDADIDSHTYNHSAYSLLSSEVSGHLPPLPQPPTLQNLEDVADIIAALQHVQQRDNLAMMIAKDDCLYLKELLALFPSAEARGDYGKLATLAACVKTILLLNEPSILDLIVTVAEMFEHVCSCLEYDPDLREKANHRWFLRERAKFRTVVPMEDEELVASIHRSFRVSYLRDTLLRPTMDESSLSTLASLQTFIHAEVVKGVTMAPGTELEGGSLYDSYLVRVIDMLCLELHAIAILEWTKLDQTQELETTSSYRIDQSVVFDKQSVGATHTKQYLAPQDGSLESRKMRRRGCLLFLKELFTMVRLSLQQSDKDDFFSVICTLEIDLNEGVREIGDNVSQTSQQVEVGSVASTVKSDRLDEKLEQHTGFDAQFVPPPTNLLSMLGNVLADPGADSSEKCAVLDILVGVAMHDPSLIRGHCLDFHMLRRERLEDKVEGIKIHIPERPEPNEKKQVLYICASDDVMNSLLFTLAVEKDAGILLQVSEILRIVLDTDMMSDHSAMNPGFADEAGVLPSGNIAQHLQQMDHSHHASKTSDGGINPSSTDQKQFLSLFYEHYVEWLVAPFQFQILYPIRPIPANITTDVSLSHMIQQRILAPFQRGMTPDNRFVLVASECSISSSFAVELLSFCVRAHLYRMKFFLLRSRVIGTVLSLLQPRDGDGHAGSRALKLAVLRFLRAILSVNDEFYHRHIVQNDLFAPVFEALRLNPVGDNLLSSAIIEMCDYVHHEKIMSLIEYIVSRHLAANEDIPSLEDLSSPYVNTLSVLRKAYEEHSTLLESHQLSACDSLNSQAPNATTGEHVVGGHPLSKHGHQNGPRQLSGRALEDQRKFHENDEEESYFDSDDSFDTGSRRKSGASLSIDEVARQQVVENELHRTPRMFSLAQAPLFSLMDGQKMPLSPPPSSLSPPHANSPSAPTMDVEDTDVP